MSSRLVKSGAVQTHEVTWRSVPVHAPPPGPPSLFHTAKPQPAEPMQDNRTPELEARIRQLEREVEQRAQASFQQGVQQGDASARQQLAAQTEAVQQRLARAIEEVASLRQRCRHEAEQDVVQLALAIARRILHRELTIDPTALLGLVKAALDQLDAREIHKVRVHPDAVNGLRKQLESMGPYARLQVEADPGLQPGSVVLETSRGTLDASADTQFAEIERGFTDLVRHSQ